MGHHKIIEVDGNHSETIHGGMALHIGSSGIGRVLSQNFRKMAKGISEIASSIPVPGLQSMGRGVLSIFADNAINEATTGIKSQFIGGNKIVHVGNTATEKAGNSIQFVSGSQFLVDAADAVTLSSGEELHISVGKSEMRMTSDGFIRLSGDTLYLNFSNGIEMIGGAEIVANAPKISLN